jgi:predicted ATP-grasp superfamily ATP-dependent carboligase
MKTLVTGATRNTGLGVIRALATAGHHVIAADERSLPLGLRSRYCDRYLLHAEQDSSEFVPSLLEIIKAHRPDVFVPLDAEGEISKHREEFQKLTRLLAPPYASFCKAFYKEALLGECVELGIPAPRLLPREQARLLMATAAGPGTRIRLVVKPSADVGGGRGVFYVEDLAGLEKALDSVSARHGRAIITEFVPGGTDAMRALHLLFDPEGKLAAHCIHRKLIEYPLSGGFAGLAVSTDEFHLVEGVLPFFSRWRWQGPVDVELKIDAETGEPKIIEINPRFSGITSFSIACGVNLPVLTCELAAGATPLSPSRVGYRAGIKCVNSVVLAKGLWVKWKAAPANWRSLIDAIRMLKGAKVAEANWIRDPLPTIGKCLLEIREWLRRRRSHWRRRPTIH